MPEKQGKKWEKAKRWWAKIWHEYREACLLLLFAIAGVALSAGALGLLKDVIVGDTNLSPNPNPNPYQGFPWVLGLPFLTAPVLLRIWLVRFRHKEADLATARDNANIARENASIAQKSERNQRYTTIITQLSKTLPFHTGDSGHTEERPHWDVRIGGLYALEKLMQEAPAEYHDIGINVLCAYVRNSQQFREESHTSEQPAQVGKTWHRPIPDVQVALTILGRRKERDDEPKIDLRRVDLERTDMLGATLRGADLSFANLAHADLMDANLTNVNLVFSDLLKAHLVHANLAGADLRYTDLNLAELGATDLENANLEGVDLRGVYLEGGNLKGAKIEGAKIYKQWEGSEMLKGTKGKPIFIDTRSPDERHPLIAPDPDAT